MKIIVVSDSHGSSASLKKIMKMHQNADVVVHCGDSRGEMEEIKMLYPDITYYEVAGNCDWGSTLPLTVTFELDGFKYMATHGHTYSVKFGLGQLCYAAEEAGVDCVFFGHTHYACDEVYEGIRLINPGSCGGMGASFAVVETKDGQMLTNIAHLKNGLFK